MDLKCCLGIVNILNNEGTLDEAKAELKRQAHSENSSDLVCSLVYKFSAQGNEFLEYVTVR